MVGRRGLLNVGMEEGKGTIGSQEVADGSGGPGCVVEDTGGLCGVCVV